MDGMMVRGLTVVVVVLESRLALVLFFFVLILAFDTTLTALLPFFWSNTSYTLANPPCQPDTSVTLHPTEHLQVDPRRPLPPHPRHISRPTPQIRWADESRMGDPNDAAKQDDTTGDRFRRPHTSPRNPIREYTHPLSTSLMRNGGLGGITFPSFAVAVVVVAAAAAVPAAAGWVGRWGTGCPARSSANIVMASTPVSHC